MKEDDWKRMIENWKASRKHAELKKKYEKKMYNMTKEQIVGMIVTIKEFNCLLPEEKEAFDFMDADIYNGSSEDDVILSLIQTLMRWYYYQIIYEQEQDFELCAMIRDTIIIEIQECHRILHTYFSSEISIEELEELSQNSREQIKLNLFK